MWSNVYFPPWNSLVSSGGISISFFFWERHFITRYLVIRSLCYNCLIFKKNLKIYGLLFVWNWSWMHSRELFRDFKLCTEIQDCSVEFRHFSLGGNFADPRGSIMVFWMENYTFRAFINNKSENSRVGQFPHGHPLNSSMQYFQYGGFWNNINSDWLIVTTFYKMLIFALYNVKWNKANITIWKSGTIRQSEFKNTPSYWQPRNY